jgi:hypothetical protein
LKKAITARVQSMSDLYEDDILLWSEQQGDLLRRLARGEKVNEQIDWENVAEEIVDVGRTQRLSCESNLLQAVLHELKAQAWPQSTAVPHWRSEARVARANARRAFSPSMRQRIDIAEIYATALGAMPETIDGQAPQPVPQTCPFTLDELLAPVKRQT